MMSFAVALDTAHPLPLPLADGLLLRGNRVGVWYITSMKRWRYITRYLVAYRNRTLFNIHASANVVRVGIGTASPCHECSENEGQATLI